MKALFHRVNLDYIVDFLKLNGIDYEEWNNQDLETEIRIDKDNLTEKQIRLLKQEFTFSEPIDDYDYIIFWK